MTTGPAGNPSNRPTQPAPAAAPPAGERFGKFVRVEKLGAGGMGEVWKSWDTELSRWIALKFLTGSDAEEIARFKREAQAAGRLSHPHIASVYEVGEAQGRLFIAMQYVPGATLGRTKAPVKQLVAMIRDAACAVQYAHEQGIVHRDLKPDNIMVAQAHAFVMDFGLARVADAGRSLSQSGFAIGTPAYMPPEQARGEIRSTDARSDVYSLGATLYAVLGGRPPFTGRDTFSVLAAVVGEDPPPLRSLARVPADLETIVMKCLEKEPTRRYASAADFADDLDRFLAGESVRARPPGAMERMARALRKRSLLVFVAALVLVVAVGTLIALSRWKSSAAGAQEDLLQRMRVNSHACLSAALDLRRTGNLDGMQEKASQVEEICRLVLKERPLAEAHYLIGRMYRAQLRDADALREQEAALAVDARYGPARYEHVILLCLRFQHLTRAMREMALGREGERRISVGGGIARGADARSVPTFDEMVVASPQAQERLKEIDDDVSQLLDAADHVTAAMRECAQAIRARIRRGDAEPALRRVVAGAPDVEEAREALIVHLMERGQYDVAVTEATAGLERDRGYLPFLDHRFTCWMVLGEAVSGSSGDPRPLYDRARPDIDELLRRRPDHALYHREFGRLRLNTGLYLDRTNSDGLTLIEQSLASYTEAIRLDPGQERGWRSRGLAQVNLAIALFGRGHDAERVLQAALADYAKAIELSPTSAAALEGRGLVHQTRALLLEREGKEAEPPYRLAIADVSLALKLNPSDMDHWVSRGSVRMNLAIHLFDTGRDPEPELRAAMEDLEEAVRLSPDNFDAVLRRGETRSNWAYVLVQTGRNPGEQYDRAAQDLDRATKLNPGSYEAWVAYGTAAKGMGTHRMGQGIDARPILKAAVEALDVAIKLNGGPDEAWVRRGSARIELGRISDRAGEKLFRDALDDYTEALRRNRKRPDSWAGRGLAGANLGAFYFKVERDDEGFEAMALASADLEKAIELNPRNADPYFYRGVMRRNWALMLEFHKRPETKATLRGAVEDFTRAKELRPVLEAQMRAMLDECRAKLKD